MLPPMPGGGEQEEEEEDEDFESDAASARKSKVKPSGPKVNVMLHGFSSALLPSFN